MLYFCYRYLHRKFEKKKKRNDYITISHILFVLFRRNSDVFLCVLTIKPCRKYRQVPNLEAFKTEEQLAKADN